jgi:hypothetical protein
MLKAKFYGDSIEHDDRGAQVCTALPSGGARRYCHADIVPGRIHLNETATPLVGAKLVIV